MPGSGATRAAPHRTGDTPRAPNNANGVPVIAADQLHTHLGGMPATLSDQAVADICD